VTDAPPDAPRDAPPPDAPPDAALAGQLAAKLDALSQARLGRSLALFHVGGGGCGGCELELRALRGAAYGLERLGLTFVASPRHADVLLVTGPPTRAMAEPLRRAWEAVPDPKWVVAVGACAIDGGVFAGSYAVLGGVGAVLTVDMVIPGCPPSPAQVLQGLRTLIEANV